MMQGKLTTTFTSLKGFRVDDVDLEQKPFKYYRLKHNGELTISSEMRKTDVLVHKEHRLDGIVLTTQEGTKIIGAASPASAHQIAKTKGYESTCELLSDLADLSKIKAMA